MARRFDPLPSMDGERELTLDEKAANLHKLAHLLARTYAIECFERDMHARYPDVWPAPELPPQAASPQAASQPAVVPKAEAPKAEAPKAEAPKPVAAPVVPGRNLTGFNPAPRTAPEPEPAPPKKKLGRPRKVVAAPPPPPAPVVVAPLPRTMRNPFGDALPSRDAARDLLRGIGR